MRIYGISFTKDLILSCMIFPVTGRIFTLPYVSTYIDRDINSLIDSDSITFSKFMIAVAARSGEICNYSNIASQVGVSEPTVKVWLSILERTVIILSFATTFSM